VKKRVHRARLLLRERLDAHLSIACTGSPMHVAAPSTFLAALREKFASAHPALNKTNRLALAWPLLTPTSVNQAIKTPSIFAPVSISVTTRDWKERGKVRR